MLQVFYFEGVFQEFWLQIVEQILYRTYVIQNSHFWAKLSLSACGTFLSLNLVCIWCPIFNARVQSFKESRTVTMESFSTELIEAITHRCSIKSCSQNIEGTYNRTSVPKYEFMCVVCVCVCVCVCFFTCTCVFILFHREGLFRLQDVWDILEGYGSTMLCCEYHSRCFCQVPSSRYLKM